LRITHRFSVVWLIFAASLKSEARLAQLQFATSAATKCVCQNISIAKECKPMFDSFLENQRVTLMIMDIELQWLQKGPDG